MIKKDFKFRSGELIKYKYNKKKEILKWVLFGRTEWPETCQK